MRRRVPDRRADQQAASQHPDPAAHRTRRGGQLSACTAASAAPHLLVDRDKARDRWYAEGREQPGVRTAAAGRRSAMAGTYMRPRRSGSDDAVDPPGRTSTLLARCPPTSSVMTGGRDANADAGCSNDHWMTNDGDPRLASARAARRGCKPGGLVDQRRGAAALPGGHLGRNPGPVRATADRESTRTAAWPPSPGSAVARSARTRRPTLFQEKLIRNRLPQFNNVDHCTRLCHAS